MLERAVREAPVYVHCWGGVGRTGTVVACWLLKHHYDSAENVLQTLAELRSMDVRRGHRRSPETEVQLRLVTEWARRLAR